MPKAFDCLEGLSVKKWILQIAGMVNVCGGIEEQFYHLVNARLVTVASVLLPVTNSGTPAPINFLYMVDMK